MTFTAVEYFYHCIRYFTTGFDLHAYHTFLWHIFMTHFYDTFLRHIFVIHFTTHFYDPHLLHTCARQVTCFWARHSAPCSFHGMDDVFMSTLTSKLLIVIAQRNLRRVTFSEFVQVEVVMQRKEVTWSTFVQVRLIPARASSVCHSEWALRPRVSRSMVVSWC